MKQDSIWTAITANKQAARIKLKELPWREKLLRLDAMRERQESLRAMRRRLPSQRDDS